MYPPQSPEQTLASIYLGDRACKAILIASWKRRVALQVDVISRLRPGTKTWDFYTDEDLVDGWLVFDKVLSCTLDRSGLLPNDYIGGITVRRSVSGADLWTFEVDIGAVTADSISHETKTIIEAEVFYVATDPMGPIEDSKL